MKDNEKKNQETVDQKDQPPKKESFLKRTFKRFGRDLLKIGGGIAIGAVVTATVFKARSEKAVEEETDEDQEEETESEDVEEDSEE